MYTTSKKSWQIISSFILMALILLCVAWELWLAPLRPGGSMLFLKGIFLVLLLPGIIKGKRYTYQCSAIFIWLYFVEGVVRATTEHGISQSLAIGETALSLLFFVVSMTYIRSNGKG